VVPATAATLVAFLAFVSPGLVFELLRGRARPQLQRTAFVEVSTVVLSSLFFSIAAIMLVAIARLWLRSWFVEPSRWLDEGAKYAAAQPARVLVTVTLELAIACLLALAAHRLICRNPKGLKRPRKWIERMIGPGQLYEMTPHSAWWEILQGRLPDGTTGRSLSINIAERVVSGRLYGFDDETLVLQAPVTVYWSESDVTRRVEPTDAQLVVIPMSQVTMAGVRYISDIEVPREAPVTESD
jgi:hypothetical protein